MQTGHYLVIVQRSIRLSTSLAIPDSYTQESYPSNPRNITPEWHHPKPDSTPKVAPTMEAVFAGDGCHPDEARALSDYLNGSISAEETARRITATILNESNPPEELYRLWSLLSEGLVELSPHDRHNIVDLLSQIESLPPQAGIQWADLPDFGGMWDTLHRLHLHGSGSWEYSIGSFEKEQVDDLRNTFTATGCAEAEMFLRGIVPADWGYEVLNLACSERGGLDVFVSEVFAWLNTAHVKLKEGKARSETASLRFTRPVPNSPSREKMAVEATLAEHCNCWKKALLGLSQEGSGLSSEGIRVAGRCHELM
jgi:hypothetical protein